VNQSGSGPVEVLRRGWRESPELRVGFRLSVLFALVGAAGRIAVPVLTTYAIDNGLREGDVRLDVIVRAGVVAALAILASTVLTRLAGARLSIRGERALHGMRVRAFDHIMRLDLGEHAEERRGVLVARTTSDIETLSQFLSWGAVSWLVNTAVIAIVAITMVVYDWRLALVAFATSLPSVLVFKALQRKLISAYTQVRESVAAMLVALSEVVMGAAVVRAYGSEERARARVVDAVHAYRDHATRANRMAALLFPSGEVFAVLTVSVVVVLAVRLGPDSSLTEGGVIGFLFLVNRFLDPVQEFTEIIDQTQTAAAAWRRVLDVTDTPIRVAPPLTGRGVELPAGPLGVRFDGVAFRYHDATVDAIESLSVTIPPGEQVAIVGETGSGKSTLARLLVRLADPTGGVISVGGVDLREADPVSLRERVVLVPQEPFLFDRSIADNVRFGRPESTDDDVRQAFADLGLGDWIARRSLEDPVGERGASLSLGERQLVALARAFLSDPALLVLDEATSAVDPETDALLGQALVRVAQGRTAVVIAHRLSTAARADRIWVMADARLVEDGSHDELLAADGTYARLYASWLDATTV
jgi:ATP-binding cassette, subfamily B, bacterial